MAIEEVDQESWELAVANVTKQQEEAFDALFNEAVEEHLKDDCADCKDELCSNCEEHISTRIEEWQESQFDDQAEAEYDRLEEQQEETRDGLTKRNPCRLANRGGSGAAMSAASVEHCSPSNSEPPFGTASTACDQPNTGELHRRVLKRNMGKTATRSSCFAVPNSRCSPAGRREGN